MKTNEQGITFQAVFNKATTTVDGGWRISFDVPESEAANLLELAGLRGCVFQVACVPIELGLANVATGI